MTTVWHDTSLLSLGSIQGIARTLAKVCFIFISISVTLMTVLSAAILAIILAILV